MWIFDQPIYIAAIGLVVSALLVAGWSMSGRKELLYAVAAVLLVMAGFLIAERYVVTDREAIEATLAEIARDVQTNATARVVRHIAATRPELKERAQKEMPHYQFSHCHVAQIHKIDVASEGEPRTAIVEFNVSVTGDFQAEGMQVSGTFPRWVRLQMVREADGKWKVEGYEHAPPQQSIMNIPLEGGRSGDY
jgi:hypothetical protein